MAMQIGSMVHGSGREREVHDHHRRPQHYPHQQQHQQHQQQQTAQHQQPASYYPQPPQQRPYGTSASPSPYPAADYQYQRPPQSPPSPPVEDQKPSLPSISSLLTIADNERAATESAAQSPRSQQHPSPQARHEQQRAHQSAAHQAEGRPDQASHAFGQTIVSNPKMTLPPTPPMHADSVVDGNQSPSAASSHSNSNGPYYLGQSLNNMEPHQQRQHMTDPAKRHSIASQPGMSPYNTSPYAASPYASSPGAGSAGGSFYSPEPNYSNAGIYSQRALPSNFEPHHMPLPAPNPSANGSNVWQHHHYISASSQSAFPQSQDRYVCTTCNKAFSRPSSLRIHSHSHTGEKPYKCPQPGCGKAFSVRSNMKRHERGCHASAGATNTTTT